MSITARAMPVASGCGSSLTETRARVSALRAWLQTSESRPTRPDETHIAWVLPADSLACKIKKPVRLPFLTIFLW